MALVFGNRIGALMAGSLLATAFFIAAPARADEETAFGQPLPKQFLLNRLTNPKPGEPEPVLDAKGQPVVDAKGQPVLASPEAAAAAREAEEQGEGPFPKRYLFNRLFDGK
jgi:hypothetical protein